MNETSDPGMPQGHPHSEEATFLIFFFFSFLLIYFCV